MNTIVHPTDGSPEARQATAHAVALAAKHDATLHAVFVVDTQDLGEPALSSVEVLIGEYEDRGREVLSEVETVAADHDVPVETRCCHGMPAAEVREYADSVGADLIVVGDRASESGTVARRLDRTDDRVVVA